MSRILAGLVVMTMITGFVCPSLLFSQEKWGKVSDEILKMTTFAEDSTADAVILFDVGEQKITENFNLIMQRHVRIKILTEEGKKFADVKIPYWYKDDIDDIDAQTFLPNGKKIELKGKQIHEEELRKYYNQIIFAMPGVEVGSVIEYRYKFRSEYLTHLEPWYFQNEAYTVLSQISVVLQPGFGYNAFFQNVTGNALQPEIEEFLVPGPMTLKGKRFTWRMLDLPPIVEEKYIRRLNDYRAAFSFQLTEYKNAYVYYKFIKSWPELGEKQYEYYEEYLDSDGKIREQVKELISDTLNNEEKIKTLYEFVRDKIETDRIYSIYIENKPSDLLKDMKGRISDKNFLLINMLLATGFEAHPMFVSTRSHGRVALNAPNLQSFNKVIVYVQDGTNRYYLDTKEHYCPFGFLPEEDLVERGFLISKDESRFVDLPECRSINMQTFGTQLELTPEGHLYGRLDVRFEGYRAMSMRKKLSGKSDKKDYLQDWISETFAQAVVDSFEISFLDDLDVPLMLTVSFNIPEYAQVIGDHIYLEIPQITKMTSNPFKKLKRYFPIEYSYMYSTSESMTIQLPEGFIVDEVPLAQIYRHDGMFYMADCKCEENMVSFRSQYLVKKLTFNPVEYDKVRDFHNRIIDFEKSQIVLKNDVESM